MSASLKPLIDGEPVHRRLFFALWPDAALRERIATEFGAAADAAGGQRVPAANLHVTLEFLGSVADTRRAELEALGAGTALPEAEFVLDSIDWWPRPALLAAGSRAPSAALTVLQARLRSLLAGAGFRVDSRAYRPHITLARQVRARPALGRAGSLSWPIRELALVESLPAEGGSRYVPLATWTRR